jgi:hypothetical protein
LGGFGCGALDLWVSWIAGFLDCRLPGLPWVSWIATFQLEPTMGQTTMATTIKGPSLNVLLRFTFSMRQIQDCIDYESASMVVFHLTYRFDPEKTRFNRSGWFDINRIDR